VSEQARTPLPALMSVPDAAKFLGLSRASAYRYAEAGLLPIKRFGRRVYVVRARLTEFLATADTTAEVDAA
jgi:excisionase family DNA binding protein